MTMQAADLGAQCTCKGNVGKLDTNHPVQIAPGPGTFCCSNIRLCKQAARTRLQRQACIQPCAFPVDPDAGSSCAEAQQLAPVVMLLEYQLAGTIEKEIGGETKSYKFVRADRFTSRDDMSSIALAKGRQMRGHRIVESEFAVAHE